MDVSLVASASNNEFVGTLATKATIKDHSHEGTTC